MFVFETCIANFVLTSGRTNKRFVVGCPYIGEGWASKVTPSMEVYTHTECSVCGAKALCIRERVNAKVFADMVEIEIRLDIWSEWEDEKWG